MTQPLRADPAVLRARVADEGIPSPTDVDSALGELEASAGMG